MSAEYVARGVTRQARVRVANRAPFLGRVFTQGPLRLKRGDVVARLSPGEEASPKTARYDAPRWHDGLPVNILPIRTLRGGFESHAPHDRQVRVAREARIGRRAPAEAERGPAAGLDDPRMPARRAQTRRWGSHVATPVKASVARWRRGWDSNPRSLSTLRFSRAPPSTARPPLRRSGYQRRSRSPAHRIRPKGSRGGPLTGYPRATRRKSAHHLGGDAP